MKFFILVSLIVLGLQSFGQINGKDSTVQVIGFWNKAEKQSYSVSLEKIKLKAQDTTSRELISYDVEITIKDSASNSYLIEWYYKNFRVNTQNKITQRLASLSQDVKVLIKTDEMGAIQEVVNWREVKDYMKSTMDKFLNDFKEIPKMDKIIAQVQNLYSSKEAIEASAIQDAQQFYTFHGAKYKLAQQLDFKTKGPNIFGGEPFDLHCIVYLDEINSDGNNYIMRSRQEVDAKQLTEATVKYLNDLSTKTGSKPISKNDIKDLTNETSTASRIHESGWVIYSIQTKTVTSDDVTNIEERIIEIK